MKPYAESFYSSAAWQACRKSYAKSVGGLCEICRDNGLIVPGEIVHHKKHINPNNVNDPNILLNFSNLQYVCRSCHAKIHAPEERQPRRYVVDEYGKVTAREK